MRFSLNPSASEPLYTQIVRQVREAMAKGTMRSGEQLPTVRDLAMALAINPNTIAAAYREMDRLGLVYTRRGCGTFVAEVTGNRSGPERRRLLQKHIDALLTEATHLGVTEGEVLEMLRASAKRYALKEVDRERSGD
jgi:GntR family transcriptional regulator